MPEFTERVRRATADLEHIQLELERAAHPEADPAYRKRISRELLQPSVINELKAAVDNMRLILWSYMAAQKAGPDMSFQGIEAKLQSVRMQRVTEMLRVLQPDVTHPSAAALPEANTFFELIHNIAHSTLERHQGDAEPR